MSTSYINPFTDFGFKKIFGEEANKESLRHFLNHLLPLESPIQELTFQNLEQLGDIVTERKAIYDVYCKDEKGQHFLVEMQKAEQDYFKDRSIFYATFPIRQQAQKGKKWNYKLNAVYCLGLLDFVFEEDKNKPDFFHHVQLKNTHNQVFYDKLHLCFIEFPKFTKTPKELDTLSDKWLYFLKYLSDFEDIPEFLRIPEFLPAFEQANLANLTPEEHERYEASLKVYRDLDNVVDSAYSRGKVENSRDIAKQMKAKGFAVALVSELTGLSEEEIEKL